MQYRVAILSGKTKPGDLSGKLVVVCGPELSPYGWKKIF